MRTVALRPAVMRGLQHGDRPQSSSQKMNAWDNDNWLSIWVFKEEAQLGSAATMKGIDRPR